MSATCPAHIIPLDVIVLIFGLRANINLLYMQLSPTLLHFLANI